MLVAPPRRRGRVVRLLAVFAVVLAAVGVAVVIVNPFAGGGTGAGVRDNGAPTSLVAVREGSLASQTQVNGTLGYAGDYSIVNNASGAATWLPGSGQVIRLVDSGKAVGPKSGIAAMRAPCTDRSFS